MKNGLGERRKRREGGGVALPFSLLSLQIFTASFFPRYIAYTPLLFLFFFCIVHYPVKVGPLAGFVLGTIPVCRCCVCVRVWVRVGVRMRVRVVIPFTVDANLNLHPLGENMWVGASVGREVGREHRGLGRSGGGQNNRGFGFFQGVACLFFYSPPHAPSVGACLKSSLSPYREKGSARPFPLSRPSRFDFIYLGRVGLCY